MGMEGFTPEPVAEEEKTPEVSVEEEFKIPEDLKLYLDDMIAIGKDLGGLKEELHTFKTEDELKAKLTKLLRSKKISKREKKEMLDIVGGEDYEHIDTAVELAMKATDKYVGEEDDVTESNVSSKDPEIKTESAKVPKDFESLNKKLETYFHDSAADIKQEVRERYLNNLNNNPELSALVEKYPDDFDHIFEYVGYRDFDSKKTETFVKSFEVRKAEVLKNQEELNTRIKDNPRATEEEYEAGTFKESLERQVREAVFELKKKGYKPFESGFFNLEFGSQYIGIRDEDVDFEILKKNLKGFADVIKFDDRIQIFFIPWRDESMDDLKNHWNKIISMVPPVESSSEEKNINNGLQGVAFRQEQDDVRSGKNTWLRHNLAYIDGKVVEMSYADFKNREEKIGSSKNKGMSEVVADKDYENFVKTNEVSVEVLNNIVERITKGEKITEREMAIYSSHGGKVEELLKTKKENIDSKKETDNFKIETIDETLANEIFKKVKIEGDDLNGKKLTPEVLRSEGLLPKYKITIGETVYFFTSNGYNLTDSRIGVLAYVKKGDEIVVRSYYRSNSQGVWRYLPNYTVDKDGDIDWYGKGYGEESITLPISIQESLTRITSEGIFDVKDPDLVFVGTAKKHGKRNDYYEEIESEPKKIDGNFYSRDKKISPENMRINNESSPDFSNRISAWKQKSNLYGEYSIEVFSSKDGKLKYMFCRDSKGRAWIGGIEDDSELQSTGLKKSWINGGDLTTPAYEYKSQDGGYGNRKLSKSGYVDMFENYLSKSPLIQEYLKSRSTS